MALTKVSCSILKDPLNLGEVSIGGTLTYEDVTNVDSVGVITARSNIDCNGDLDVDGHTELDDLNVAGIATLGSGASGYAELFYQGVKKFETKNYGVLIPGALVTVSYTHLRAHETR